MKFGTKLLVNSGRTHARWQRNACIRVLSNVSCARRRRGCAHAVNSDAENVNDMEENESDDDVRVFGYERKTHLGPAAMVRDDFFSSSETQVLSIART